jgi:curved DNA-binding protein CbpA
MGVRFDINLEQAMDLLSLKNGFTEKEFRENYRKLIRNIHPDTLGNINPIARKVLEDEAKRVNMAKGIIESFLKEKQSNKNTAQNSGYSKNNYEEQQRKETQNQEKQRKERENQEQQRKERENQEQQRKEREDQEQQRSGTNAANNVKNNLKKQRKSPIGWGVILIFILIIMVYNSDKGNTAQYPEDQLQMKNYKNAESLGEQVSAELSPKNNPPTLDESPPTLNDNNNLTSDNTNLESNINAIEDQLKDLLDNYTFYSSQAIKTNNISLINPYVASGSDIYKEQQSYIPRIYTAGIQVNIISANITDYNISDDSKAGSITTSLVYNIITKDGTSSNKPFSYVYKFKYNDLTSSYQFLSVK